VPQAGYKTGGGRTLGILQVLPPLHMMKEGCLPSAALAKHGIMVVSAAMTG